jgi:hypothetical protein
MWQPFDTGQTGKRIRIFLPLLFLMLAMMGVFTFLGKPLTTPVAPRGGVSLQQAGDVLTVRQILSSWDEAARISAAFGLGLDFLFLCVYSTTLAFACVWAAGMLRPCGKLVTSVGILLAWGQWLAALFDATENVALLVMLRGTVENPWPQVARWCSISKFILIAVGLVYAALGGVRWLTALMER